MAESKSTLSVIDESRRAFPKREKQPVQQELDANGDVVFRFKLEPNASPSASLEAFYRASLLDLLRIVRLYSGGKPVIVDGFAFLNAPDQAISLLPAEAEREPEPVG